MLSIDWFKDKRVTVMGLGLHGGGLSAAKWLVRHGAKVTVTDLKDAHALALPVRRLDRFAALEAGAHPVRYVLGRHDAADFTDADMVIQNPGVPRENAHLVAARGAGVPIESDMSIFFSLCPFPIAGVTGTKGKTTTTSLLAAICAAHDPRTVVGGNIRIPVLDALDRLIRMDAKHDAPPPIVLELSSWQLESLAPRALSPHVAVLTNVKEDHLNRYRDMDDYASAKELVLANQKPEDVAVVNADDPRTRAMGEKRPHPYWFRPNGRPVERGCSVRNGHVVFRDGRRTEPLFPVSSIRIPGAHNIGNVLAAAAAAVLMGIPAKTVRRAVRAFTGVPGRLETVRRLRGILFVNDTTATAPDASLAAMATFGGKRKRIVLIAGGADKKLTFDEWARAAKRHAKHLVLFEGSATVKMEAALEACGAEIPRMTVASMREAVAEAVRHAKRGDIVLLSPGCASFGIFTHEFDRGDKFMKAVRALR